MPGLRRKVCVANGQRPIPVLDMPASDLANGRNDL
jgi:hypothetical protein